MAKLIADRLTLERSGRIIRAGLSFAVAAGEALAIVGPNGAGKTTLLRTIAGFLPHASGTLRLEPVESSSAHQSSSDPDTPVAEQAHYIGHLNGVKGPLSIGENITFWARYLSTPSIGFVQTPSVATPEVAIARVGLADLADVPAAYLSAGQKRRLALARLLVAPRLVWLLDEPTSSLDQAGQELLATLAREHLAIGGIILAATHLPLGFAPSQTLDLGGAAAP